MAFLYIPIKSVTIKRRYTWGGEDIIDETKTNNKGEFNLPAIYEISLWGYQKGNYEEDGKLDGKQINMICDIKNEKKLHKANSYKNYMGICKTVKRAG